MTRGDVIFLLIAACSAAVLFVLLLPAWVRETWEYRSWCGSGQRAPTYDWRDYLHTSFTALYPVYVLLFGIGLPYLIGYAVLGLRTLWGGD